MADDFSDAGMIIECIYERTSLADSCTKILCVAPFGITSAVDVAHDIVMVPRFHEETAAR